MIGYSAIEVFAPQLLAVHQFAAALVDALPDTVDGAYVRCHEAARHVARRLHPLLEESCAIAVVDGWYHRTRSQFSDHSWIELRPHPTPGRVFVLDVYSVARLPMVTLVEKIAIYETRNARADVREDVLDILDRAEVHDLYPDRTLRDALAGRDPKEVRGSAVVREVVTAPPSLIASVGTESVLGMNALLTEASEDHRRRRALVTCPCGTVFGTSVRPARRVWQDLRDAGWVQADDTQVWHCGLGCKMLDGHPIQKLPEDA